MHGRARAFLAIVALRNFGSGVLCLTPGALDGPQLSVVRSLMPLWLQGLVMVAVALIAATFLVLDDDVHARIACVLSAGVTAMWAGGLTWATSHGSALPLLPLIMWALVAKDLVVSGMQLRIHIDVEKVVAAEVA